MAAAIEADRAAPAVSEIFSSWTASIVVSHYTPEVESDPEFDDESIISLDSIAHGEDESIEPAKKSPGELCHTCAQLDLNSIFHHGVRGYEQTQAESTRGQDAQPEIILGSLEAISQRNGCPFCRLVYQLGDEKYPGLLAADSALGDIIPLITCWLQAV
jgi:hypothetical protein